MNRVELIMQRNGCSEKEARIIAGDLEKLNPALAPLLERWEATGEESDDTLYEGWSLNSLKAKFKMKFTGALLTLDWLLRDPETARAALARGFK